MTQLDTQPAGIGEEQLQDRAPLVRALVVQRLEMIWRTCEPHITGASGRPDPRYVEAGIRVLDRLMRLYRLDAPARASDDAGPVVDGALVLDERMQEILSRLQPE